MNAVAAEALADPRTGPSRARRSMPSSRAGTRGRRCRPTPTLGALRRDRKIEWATQTLTQGEILDAFAAYCRDELDDVEVLDARAEPPRARAGVASGARSSCASATRSASASPRRGRHCCSARSARRRWSVPRGRGTPVTRRAPRSRAAREDRRRPLERLRLPRVVPARRVRREDPARVRVHERPRRTRDHLARHGVGRSGQVERHSRARRGMLHTPTQGGGLPLSPAADATGSGRTPLRQMCVDSDARLR